MYSLLLLLLCVSLVLCVVFVIISSRFSFHLFHFDTSCIVHQVVFSFAGPPGIIISSLHVVLVVDVDDIDCDEDDAG